MPKILSLSGGDYSAPLASIWHHWHRTSLPLHHTPTSMMMARQMNTRQGPLRLSGAHRLCLLFTVWSTAYTRL